MVGNSHILRFEKFVVEQSVYPAKAYMPPHTDKLSRISIILDGKLQETAGSKEVTAGAGSLVIKPNHVVHENIFGDRPVRSLSISFHDDMLMTNNFNKWQWLEHPKINVLGDKTLDRDAPRQDGTGCYDLFHRFFFSTHLIKV